MVFYLTGTCAGLIAGMVSHIRDYESGGCEVCFKADGVTSYMYYDPTYPMPLPRHITVVCPD